jgi:hypothetical protein
MKTATFGKKSKWLGEAIRDQRISLSRDSGKLCSGQPEMLRASLNNLPLPMVRGGLLQSRKPFRMSISKPISVQQYGCKQ